MNPNTRLSRARSLRARLRRSLGVGLTAVASAALVLTLSPQSALATTGAVGPALDSETASISAPPVSSTGRIAAGIDPTGYWTPERLAASIDADLLVAPAAVAPQRIVGGAQGETPPSAGAPAPSTARAVPVPRTVGKVFYRNPFDGKDYNCTAATINTAAKNVVETAAHCVYKPGRGWYTNIAFAPAYYNGVSSYGLYNWSTARTFTSWMRYGTWSADQAFVAFAPRNGVRLVNAVGGNGFAYGYGAAQPSVRIWGYPVEGAYAGARTPYYCDGATRASGTDAVMTCGMTGGASGGPWLRTRISSDLGTVSAVTSRRTTSGTPSLLATPNSSATKSMLDQMG